MARQSKINPRYYFTERLRRFLSRPLGIFLSGKGRLYWVGSGKNETKSHLLFHLLRTTDKNNKKK